MRRAFESSRCDLVYRFGARGFALRTKRFGAGARGLTARGFRSSSAALMSLGGARQSRARSIRFPAEPRGSVVEFKAAGNDAT